MSLFIPTYFSPISQYAAIVQSDEVLFENEDNFQKQSYRNRCYIFGANGKQLLNVPVKNTNKEGKRKTKDTLIENDSPWQSQHSKSLQSAYRRSPFFEFYIDDLQPIFEKKYKYLTDLNIDSYLFLTDALQTNQTYSKTEEFFLEPKQKDFRNLASVKQHPDFQMENYIQMFDEKHGFITNLSMLDLLFMEGPNSISFLEKIELTLG